MSTYKIEIVKNGSGQSDITVKKKKFFFFWEVISRCNSMKDVTQIILKDKSMNRIFEEYGQ